MAQFYNLPSSQFEALASSILRVGVTSVATETQIAALATRLSGSGETLHLSAQEVIGFSAALASVAVRPYAAAGTFNRFAGVIRNAVASGGSELKTLAKVAGVTSDEFAKAFNSKKAGDFDKVFTALIEGFTNTKRTGGDAVNILRELGLTGVTDAQTFRQLAAAPKAVSNAFEQANDAFAKGTELQRQYGIIASTNASKIRTMANSFTALVNSFGQAGANTLAGISVPLKELFDNIDKLASAPFGGAILGLGGITTALVALAAIATAVGLRGYAGLLGVTDAMRGLRLESKVAGGALGAFRAELALTGPAGAAAAKGLGVASTAARGLTAALGPLLFIGTVAELVGQLSIGTSHAVPSMNALAKSIDKIDSKGKADSFISKLLSGDFGEQTNSAKNYLLGEATGGILKNISDVEAALSDNTIFNGLSNISTLGTANLFGQNQSGSTAKQITELDDALGKLVAGGDTKKANEIFKSLKDFVNTDPLGNKQAIVSTQQVMSILPKYTAALKDQAKQANAAAKANKLLNTGTLDVSKTLRDLLGLSSKSKFISQFEDAFAKSVQPLTDFNSVVGQVQQHITDVQEAQKAGVSVSKYVADQNRDVTVSLKQVTDQLNNNNGAQKTWLSNLTRLSSQISHDPAFGPQAATQIVSTLLAAGYSVTNASFLQQLVDATPKQRDAWIAAQQEAMTISGKAAADALLSTGYLVQANGQAIGKDTADGIAKALASGLDVQQVMQLFNLQFTQNPLIPQVDTKDAQTKLQEFIQGPPGGRRIPTEVNVNTGNADTQLRRFQGKWTNKVINFTVSTTHVVSDIPGGKIGGQVRSLPGFANGGSPGTVTGYVKGPGTPTSDSILARVSNTEFIARSAAVKYYGLDFFKAVNAMRFPRYATGSYGYGPGNPSPQGQQIHVNVTQNYPTTRDPIKKLKQDAQAVLAGIWT
jgi:TP901 family phage tail tape measure protein